MTPKTRHGCRRATNEGRERDRPAPSSIRRYRTSELFGSSPWIVIEHGSVEYRLRVTRMGKLILTK
jgi:hemin uptake protein HemP